MISIGDPSLISARGTFLCLDVGVGDESDNWANRGVLLAAYRELKNSLM